MDSPPPPGESFGADPIAQLVADRERARAAGDPMVDVCILATTDALPAGRSGRAALDPLALGFQLKLLWLSGYVPHLESCVECGDTAGLVGYLPKAGGAVCAACAPPETVVLSPDGLRGIGALLGSPLADAHRLGLGERAVRDALAVVVASYEFHGGFRLKTLTA